MSVKEKWNDRYRSADKEAGLASLVLRENNHLLPEKGMALDLACGRGANAIMLAQHGLQVYAWDISDVAIEGLQGYIEKQSLSITAEVRDMELQPPEEKQFDVIVVSYYLDRNIMSDLIRALKPGGMIYYQTYSQEKVSQRGPACSAFRLARQELLQIFSELEIIVYREEGTQGNASKGMRDEVMFIGRKA
ncbi:MAG: class I SAM-dependent methyltransferase [Gammaproteobacteria bacterium]|nr:class I SAM-dependent methyltransferase [Gammaproteobacteria bacterium]